MLTVAFIVLLFLAQGPVSYGLIILFLALCYRYFAYFTKKWSCADSSPFCSSSFSRRCSICSIRRAIMSRQWKFLHISVEGIRMAVFMVLRLMLLIIATSMLTYTTSPIQLTDGLRATARPRSKLHVPVHELSMMMSIALRFIPTLIEETEKIISAQRRGADFDSGNPFSAPRP